MTLLRSSETDALTLAAERLRAIPDDAPVRLAKRTSNLFRARSVPAGHSLDLSEFAGVRAIDVAGRRALVGGLTTYEDLVAATLRHRLVPLCVPQLKTITLGGAVSGVGIESAAFRNGVPHESVIAMDILTGAGEVVHATPDNEHADLFFGFPNSYGSLGYALLLEIELEPVEPYIALRHRRFATTDAATTAIAEIVQTRRFDGQQVDYLDGTIFGPAEVVLTLGRYTSAAEQPPSDYTGQHIYYRSLQQRDTDLLTTEDYLWRWDTDWFWCSKALGAQHPLVRRLWPKRYLRSDVYWKILAVERRHDVANTVRRVTGSPVRESVIQDIEVPLDRLAEFLDFFHRRVGILPVWLCPLRQRDPARRWPLYAFDPDTVYVNVGFWSSVGRQRGSDPSDGAANRSIEQEVSRLQGKKSLYSTSYYSREEFDRIYGGAEGAALKARYDPAGRFPGLYDKCVRRA